MNTVQLTQSLTTSLPNDVQYIFKGTYAANQIPYTLTNRDNEEFAVIANTENLSQPGEHWIAIYRPPKGPYEYMDTRGNAPVHPNILRILSSSQRGFIFNDFPIQSPCSSLCGEYCMTFIYLRLCCKFAFDDFFQLFSRFNLLKNDLWIHNFVNKHLSVIHNIPRVIPALLPASLCLQIAKAWENYH